MVTIASYYNYSFFRIPFSPTNSTVELYGPLAISLSTWTNCGKFIEFPDITHSPCDKTVRKSNEFESKYATDFLILSKSFGLTNRWTK